MSSAICQNFVQNAWKKELCANCFKSKDEHDRLVASARTPSLNLCLRKDLKGIIKGAERFRPKRSVCFTPDLTKVIGFGGEDWSNGVEDEGADDDDGFEIEEEENEGEDEAELQKLTKANTDFNTTSLGDSGGGEPGRKSSYAHLMLGKPLVDAEGKKQTLLVSVTPFGQDSLLPSCRKFNKAISHIPIARNSKDSLVEAKTNVVLTSYSKNSNDGCPDNSSREEKSLLDEISETLENSKNPIQIMSTRKKTQKEIVLSVSKPEPNSKSPASDPEPKKNDAEVDLSKDAKLARSSMLERKNGIARTAIIKRDQEKPSVYQTSTAKIELLNVKNLRLNARPKIDNDKTEIINGGGDGNVVKTESARDEEKEVVKVAGDDAGSDKRDVEGSSLTEAAANGAKVEKKILGLPPQVPKYQNLLFNQSREQAGEPDGRADPDVVAEPPALPLTPPPNLETQQSFLHGGAVAGQQIYDKPKIPSKPAAVAIRKANCLEASPPGPCPVLTTFATAEPSKVANNNNNKRKAPKPPHVAEEASSIYTRNSTGPVNFDSPVVREKEKRERASSCSPKVRDAVVSVAVVNGSPRGGVDVVPEPAPRRLLSLSTDSLASACCDEKRKEKTKGRFSLKKFLRMGSNSGNSRDVHKLNGELFQGAVGVVPQPKPRLVIVHPIDLNGAKVEVVPKPVPINNNNIIINEHQVEYASGGAVANNPVVAMKFAFTNGGGEETRQATKPPPPPRSTSDECGRAPKPSIPHPPKSADIISKQKQYVARGCAGKKTDSVYANIGEVRSAITPNKPQRTASMREREAAHQVQQRKGDDNVYDYVSGGGARSSSPECDSSSSPEKDSPPASAKGDKGVGLCKRRSESSVDVSGDYFKFQNIPRSMSLTYCGSETESEIYSPYSFYGSESEITEDDHDWTAQHNRTHKLRSRKGRSIVHKNLEDNYGAVIVANHEALAQVLENIQQTTMIQPALRGLKTTSNLCWTDFSVMDVAAPIFVGTKAFHQALWNVQHVTLMLSPGSSSVSPLSLGTFGLVPITEFSDLIPERYLFPEGGDDDKNVQATIAVFPWIQTGTLQSFGEALKSKASQNHEEVCKEASFVLLQMVNALKMLQAQGIEELQLSLNSFVLCKEMDKDAHYRLCVLPGLGEELQQKNGEKYGSLCVCASKALKELLPTSTATSLIESLLNTERAVSLTQVKSVLEFSLWGPSDVALGTTIRERELALQRWLDLQRATVLHGLVCTRVQLTVYEEYHLMFLVRSNARMMCDASLLLESSHVQHGHK